MYTQPHWVEFPKPGRIAIMPRPKGGDELPEELWGLRSAGAHIIVSLLTAAEQREVGLREEAARCRAAGLEYVSYPIEDRSIPSTSQDLFLLVKSLDERLRKGKNIVIHCRAGIGRSGLVAACLMIHRGIPVDTAWQRLIDSRGCAVPDTPEQRDWVDRFARFFRIAPPPSPRGT